MLGLWIAFSCFPWEAALPPDFCHWSNFSYEHPCTFTCLYFIKLDIHFDHSLQSMTQLAVWFSNFCFPNVLVIAGMILFSLPFFPFVACLCHLSITWEEVILQHQWKLSYISSLSKDLQVGKCAASSYSFAFSGANKLLCLMPLPSLSLTFYFCFLV